MLRAAAMVAALLAAACAPRVDPRSPFDEDDPRAGRVIAATPVDPDPPVAAEPAVAEPAPPPAVTREGEVTRATLVAVLDAGPSELLRGFEVAAEEQRGRFVGWRLVRTVRGAWRFDGVDLTPGDVLLAVNGRALVRPADLSSLWSELYGAETIVAELRRGPGRLVLRYRVVGAPVRPPPTSTATAPVPTAPAPPDATPPAATPPAATPPAATPPAASGARSKTKRRR